MSRTRYVFLILLFSTMVFSCRKELSWKNETIGTGFDVQQAKDYLQERLKVKDEKIILNAPAALSVERTMATSRLVKKQVVGSAFWEKAKTYVMDNNDVVEVPFLSESNYVTVYGFSLGDALIPPEQKHRQAEASFTNLLVYRSVGRDITDVTFVTYIPDFEYLERSDFVLNRMTSDNMPSDFSGYLEYKNLEQEVLFVLRIDGGKAVKHLRPNIGIEKSRGSTASLRMDSNIQESAGAVQTTSGCQTVCTPIYETICVDPLEGPGGEGTGEVCVTEQVGQNCATVCDGGGTPTDPPNPGDGGGGTQNPPPISDEEVGTLIDEVFDRCNEFGDGTTAYNQFKSETKALLERNGTACFTKYMLNYLKEGPGRPKIPLCMDGTISGGQYNAADKTMKFGSMMYVEKSTILHELIHAVQDQVYPGGIGQYASTGKPDIEFETALFIDMMTRVNSDVPSALYDDAQQTYRGFLNEMIQDNFNGATTFFGNPNVQSHPDYVNFFNGFRARHTIYNGPVAGLSPLLIKRVLTYSECASN